MARTILLDFAQGGGSIFTEGRATIAPTHSRVLGETVILPGTQPSNPPQLVDGKAQFENVDPTPSDPNGWRYQVRIEGTDRRVHEYLVEVPDGTTTINFDDLPVVASMTLPLDASGVQLQQWLSSVRSQAAAADADALAALQAAAAAHTRIDGINVQEMLPSGGTTGMVLAKKSNTDYDLEWRANPGPDGGAVLRHENISDPGPGTPLRSVNMDYPPDPNDAPDFFRYTIQNEITMWQNEWGALRGTPSKALKTDALVRGICRDDLGPTAAGGFIELTQRWFPMGDDRRQTFQVRWRDGAIIRNNVEMALCYVRYGATPIPTHLPPGTVVVTVND